MVARLPLLLVLDATLTINHGSDVDPVDVRVAGGQEGPVHSLQ